MLKSSAYQADTFHKKMQPDTAPTNASHKDHKSQKRVTPTAAGHNTSMHASQARGKMVVLPVCNEDL